MVVSKTAVSIGSTYSAGALTPQEVADIASQRWEGTPATETAVLIARDRGQSLGPISAADISDGLATAKARLNALSLGRAQRPLAQDSRAVSDPFSGICLPK